MNCLRCDKAFEPQEKPLHGLHQACFCYEFQVSPKIDFSDVHEETQNSAAPRAAKDPAFRKFNTSFFHGKYRKYSATLENKNYILKQSMAECPELPIIEYLCNQLAAALGLNVPNHHLIRFQNKSYAFVSRNFMDEVSPATLDHIYKFLGEDIKLDCETICKTIETQTGRLSEVEKFVEICLFDAWIGNDDRHGRNLALITRAGGQRSLSPVYDNPSYIGITDEDILGADLQPRGAIYTAATDKPNMKDYVTEFHRLGHDSVIKRFKQKLIDRSTGLFGIIRNCSLLSEARKKAFITLLEKRMTEIDNA